MTFARPLAIHNIAVAAPYSLTDRLVALYNLWQSGGASTLYTASLQTEITTASPGLGSYSFLLKRDGQPNATQYNVRNYGTQAAPSTTLAYVAINPDGDLDEIVNSITAQNIDPATPANQNGSLGRPCIQSRGAADLLQVFEFDDAIAVLGFSTSSVLHYDCAHFGEIIQPRWADDVDGGGLYNLRLGLGTLGGKPISSGVISKDIMWGATTNYPPYGVCVRLGTGNVLSADDVGSSNNSYQTPWTARSMAYGDVPTITLAKGYNNLGASSVDRFVRCAARFFQGAHIGEYKYLKLYPSQFPNRIWQKAGSDYLLSFGELATATAFLWLHTTASYNPLVLGSYT